MATPNAFTTRELRPLLNFIWAYADLPPQAVPRYYLYMARPNEQTMGELPIGYVVVDSDTVYDGRIVRVRRDQVRMPDGKVATREVVETTDAVAVVALSEEGDVYLIQQYRHPQRQLVWELPAGRVDVEGESPLDTAKRELAEEVRLTADVWELLTTSISSAGFATERTYIFLATGVRYQSEGHRFLARNEEKNIVVQVRPLADAILDVTSSSLRDAKTIIGLLLAAERLRH